VQSKYKTVGGVEPPVNDGTVDQEPFPEAVSSPPADITVGRAAKDKSCLLGVMRHHLEACSTDRSQPVLVIGGGQEDLDILSACGFERIVLSNIDSSELDLDAENISLPDNSYPVVFAHAVLHHCRSPHKAVGEMVRVSQKHVFFVEPNDSWSLRLLVRMGFSFPYELAAVADNGYSRAGMRNGPVPNFIYRWTGHEVEKCVSAYQPERRTRIRAYPYWDFYVNEEELLLRKESRVAALAERMGPRNLIRVLRLGQAALNLVPPLRSQGNKFFCAISKGELQPWIEESKGHFRLRERSG
jgi:SAM-dependent methyltransferase